MRITILLLALICSNLNAQNVGKTKEFTVEYPDSMHVTTVGGIYALLMPLENSEDDFRENLNILSQNDPAFKDMSLKDIVDMNLAYLKTMGVEITEPVELTFGKKKLAAYSVDYITDKLSQGLNLHIWQAYVKHKKKLFIITYTAKVASYSKYYDAMMKLVSTINLK